ncbi:MAG: GYF domain-containing protein [Pirellulales bacterium]
MGIRFNCRHCGRQLNVKSSLAGKRGRCPHCQQAIEIPAVDQAAAATGAAATAPGEQTAGDQAAGERAAGTVVEAPAPQAHKAGAVPAPGDAATPDAINEAPHLRWYLLPAGGTGQYGPASAEAFRAWIDEGRVAADSLVWREDWPDWRSAGAVFGLAGGGRDSGLPAAGPSTTAAAGGPAVPGAPLPVAPLAGQIPLAGAVVQAAAPLSPLAPVAPVAAPVGNAGAPLTSVAAPVAIAVGAPTGGGPASWPVVDPGLPSGAGARRGVRYRRRSNIGPIIAIVVLLVAMIPLSYMLWRVLNDQFHGAGPVPASPAAADG